MNLGRFRFGGVHPHDSKDTADIASSALSTPPKTVLISMSQHIGAPAQAIVKIGDQVTAGQMIAKPAQGLSVGIHASITGVVTGVSDRAVEIEAR